jgi:hypothetical protein
MVNRPPGEISLRSKQEWGLQVEAVQGGLIQTSMGESRVTYAAPEDGYQPSATFLFSTNAPQKWFTGFDQMLYLKSRSGEVYSKVLISFEINENVSDPISLRFRGIANTNSSRNWEGDPNTAKLQ